MKWYYIDESITDGDRRLGPFSIEEIQDLVQRIQQFQQTAQQEMQQQEQKLSEPCYNKAKAADPSLAEEANRFIGRYSAYFPDTADAFMYNLQKGQSFTAVCGGMTASTTVKTK